MFRLQAQAETHSRPGGPPRVSRRPCAETHSRPAGPLRVFSSYFFLFLNRLQAQAHRDPVGPLLASSGIYFFYF